MITEQQRVELWNLICKYERAVQESTRNEGDKFFEGRQDYACCELNDFVDSLAQADKLLPYNIE